MSDYIKPIQAGTTNFGELLEIDLLKDQGVEWVQLWTGDGGTLDGGYVNTAAFNEYGNGWIELDDLENLELDFAQYGQPELWFRAHEALDGWESQEMDFNTSTQVAGSIVDEISEETSLDQMFEVRNVDEGEHYFQAWIGKQVNGSWEGSFIGGMNYWIALDELADYSVTPEQFADGEQLYIKQASRLDDTGPWQQYDFVGWDVDPDIPTPGETFTLTVMGDNKEGTTGDDIFEAPLGVSLMGHTMNTLQSADVLDGNGGRNELWADLIMEAGQFGARSIEPSTQNIQEMYFNARESSRGGDNELTRAEQMVNINGRKFLDWEHIESYYSDADLKVYTLTTNRSDGGTTRLDDMTIAMNHTSGWNQAAATQADEILQGDDFDLHGKGYKYINGKLEPSSMKALFDENYIVPTITPGKDRVFYELMNMDAVNDELDPLLAVNVTRFEFEFNGVSYDLADYLNDDDATGEDITTHAGMVAELNQALNAMIADNPGQNLEDITIELGDEFTTRHPDTLNLLTGNLIVLTTTGEHNLRAEEWWADVVASRAAPIVGGEPVRNSARRERADERRGEEDQELKINIELEKVGRGSDGGGLIVGGDNYTKGFEEFDVYVRGDESKPSSLAYLLGAPHGVREEAENSLETVNIYTHPDYVDGETFADLTIGNSNTPAYSMLDVVNFDASEFLGTLTVNYAVIQSPDNYTYELGNTDDTLDLHVFDNALFQQNTSLSIIGNNGDNTINVNYGQAAGVDGQNTLIRTGNGDDTVVISAVPPTQVWDGPITDIRTGTGNDAVFLNGHREFCNIDTGEKTIYQNTGAEYFFFGGHLQVSLAGLESEWIAIDWNRNDFTTTNAQLKQAVRDAIDSRPDLAALVDYEDADGGGLDIILNTGGDFSNQTFSVDVRGPVTNLESTAFAGGVGGDPGVDGYLPQGNYDGWPDSYLNFPALAGVMTEADARQLVDAWQAYFGPQSNVGLDGTRFNGEITGTDPNDAPDFRSGDGATSPDFAGNPGAALDADNINDFLEWIQYNADSLDIFGNTFSDDGFDITGQHEVNLGRGHDVVVTPGGRGSRTDVIVNDNHFDYNTILSHSNFGWLGWNIDFRGDNYRDEVANGRGLSINPTLDGDDNVRDGHVPYTTVSMRELSPIDGRVERIDDWVRDGGGQHNSTTYMDFSDLWDLLQDPGSEQDAEEADILNRDVLTPTDSFYSFGSDELQSALNYWLTLGNDVRDADDYFFARYPNLDLGGDVSVIGAEFVVLVGKNGEVIQDEWDTGDNDQPDPYDHWRIDNEFANGEFKVFSGRVIEREIDDQDVLAFGNFTEHGIFNLAGDINPSFNFHDLDYFIDRLLDPEPPEDQPFFEITSVVGFDDIQVGESFTATVTFTNTGDARGTQEVEVGVDGEEYSEWFTHDLTLDPGESQTETYEFDMEFDGDPAPAGEYDWYVETEDVWDWGTFTLAEDDPTTDVQEITQDDDNEDFDADAIRTDPDNAVRFEFEAIDDGNGMVPVYIQNFGPEDQLQTGVAIEDANYRFDTPAADRFQIAFDWDMLPDTYIVYLQGIDADDVSEISDKLDEDPGAQELIDFVGTLDSFSDEWLVV